MTLRFIGIDPNTGGGGSPTVWVDEASGDLILQGEKAGEVLAAEVADTVWVDGHRPGIPAHETVIRIPVRMASIVREALDVAEQRAQLR